MKWILNGILFGSLVTVLWACSSNPHKARKVETEMKKSESFTGTETIGINKDGNMVIQRKVEMADELRRLQNDVYGLEDRVYGNRKFGSMGLYGALKECRGKLTSKKYGGDGKLMWTEPLERITDKEEEWNVGIDEKEKLVGVSEEFLKDRMARFKGYKVKLQKREDEYQEKLEICDAALSARQHDLNVKTKPDTEPSDNQ